MFGCLECKVSVGYQKGSDLEICMHQAGGQRSYWQGHVSGLGMPSQSFKRLGKGTFKGRKWVHKEKGEEKSQWSKSSSICQHREGLEGSNIAQVRLQCDKKEHSEKYRGEKLKPLLNW